MPLLSTNLPAGTSAALLSAAKKLDLSMQAGVGADVLGGDVIVWEASQSNELPADQAQALGESVRKGKSLLVTLSRNPGLTPMRLGFMLPTTAWETATHFEDATLPGPIAAADWDSAFFLNVNPQGVTLPFHYSIRPLAAAERGQSRYERYKRKIQHLDTTAGPNDEFWSRSLLNRDHQVRLRGNDNFASPLLVTGRYGAGRVAILAGPALALAEGAAAESFWSALLAWLKPPATMTADMAGAATPVLVVATDNHAVQIEVQNPGSAVRTVELVGRALTWEGALVGAPGGEFSTTLHLPANGKANAEMPLPAPSLTNFQALDALDAYEVRLGLLSESGASLLTQRRIAADFTPPVQIELSTDNLYDWEYPFHAPGPESLALFENRMGADVGAYAYPPGSQVNAQVVLTNGQRNLTHLARVTDETYPANPSTGALSDGGMVYNKVPTDGVEGYSMWTGDSSGENVLSFTFAHPVTLSEIVLVGSAGHEAGSNPSSVTVELDGKRVASLASLDAMFASGHGQASLAFAPARATKVSVRLPPTDRGGKKRIAPALGEMFLMGWTGDDPKPSKGQLQVNLVDAMSGESTPLDSRSLTLAAGATERVRLRCALPAGKNAKFCRLEAEFAGLSESLPIMVLQPSVTLLPHLDLRPKNCAVLGLIVSRGFRDCFPLGTGTQELTGNWANPDDLIWAYAHQFKEVNARARTEANRLYVTEGNMQHYISPWRTFNNGVPMYDLATPNLVAKMKAQANWDKSNIVVLGHSDRWDTGPDIGVLHSWQDFTEFDEHLRMNGKPGLQSKTREDLAHEIHENHEDAWQSFHLDRYVYSVNTLREAFAAKGKDLTISAQGVPMVAGPKGAELAKTIRGMSDDHSWGMWSNNVPQTTGRQMSMLAHNPVWKMSTLIQWGYNSSNLDNPMWHAPVGTTEPSRRLYYDRAWRATIRPDGSYTSIHTWGYNSNAGVAYLMTENEWQQWFMLEERHSLLSPLEPIGAGVVISSSYFADPNHIRFSAGGNTFAQSPDAETLALSFARLHEAGLSIPFSANAAALANWKGDAPLIILNLELFSAEEVNTLRGLKARGVRMVALSASKDLPASAAELFNTPTARLLPVDASKLTADQARTLMPEIQKTLSVPLQLSAGLAGYGFRMDGTSYVVVEDWREAGRAGEVRLRASAGMSHANACNVNDHVNVAVRRDGDDWVLTTTTRPGDGTLIAIQERA